MSSIDDIPTSSGIYRITCTITGLIYVGSAVNLRRRWITHCSDLRRNKHGNPKLQRAFNKYGSDAFSFEVLELILIPEMLIPREQYWFSRLQPFGSRGFNIAKVAGSTLGRKASPEAIEKNRIGHLGQVRNIGRRASPEAIAKMSAAKRGKPIPHWIGKKHSQETIEKLRITHLGQPSYWTGKKRSPETIAKARAKKLGKPSPRRPGYTHSPEHREKLRIANLGKKASEETKRKLSEMRKGRKQSPEAIEKTRIANLGRKNSPEAIARMVEARRGEMKTITLIAPDGTSHTFTGIKRFCREHGLDPRATQRLIHGKFKQHKGWTIPHPEKDVS
jgi:group I intron endonuclease